MLRRHRPGLAARLRTQATRVAVHRVGGEGETLLIAAARGHRYMSGSASGLGCCSRIAPVTHGARGSPRYRSGFTE